MTKMYQTWNFVQSTTAMFIPVACGTSLKTLLQIAPPSTEDLVVVAWGIEFDGAGPSGTWPPKVELIDTDTAATVTAHGASGICKWSNPNDPGSLVTLGTSATGFTASAEGTVGSTSRTIDAHQVPLNGGWNYEWPLEMRPRVPVSRFLRIRVHCPVAVNASCWVRWIED